MGLFRKNPRVKHYRSPRTKRDYSNLPLAMLRLYRFLLVAVPISGILLYTTLNGTPHMLYEYTYRDNGNTYAPKTYESCTYIGINGLVSVRAGDCPLIRWL
jgi:hypothetical protein